MGHEAITITSLARNLADFVNRVAYRGDRFTVMRGKRPVAELIPVPSGRRLADLPGALAALPRLGEEGATAFARDLAEARGELRDLDEADPWAS